MSIESENDLIERLAGAIRWYGCGPHDVTAEGELVEAPRPSELADRFLGLPTTDTEYDERIEYGHGHSGEGWYLSCSSYPDEGAEGGR